MENLPAIEIDEGHFLYEHCSLPSLPVVVHRLKEIIQSDDVNIKEVSNLIEKDPSLVAQILKIVNSAYYNVPREISDISFAVAYLGIHEIYRTVLSLSVINSLNINKSKNFTNFWHHSNYVALCTKFLAKKFTPLLSHEKLWPAALLHDIGKLVYLKFFPDHFNLLNKYCQDNGQLFSVAEKHLSFPKSSYLGSLLCRRWRLPNTIREACAFHNFEDQKNFQGKSSSKDLINIITLGNYVVILSDDIVKTEIKEDIALKIQKSIEYSEQEFLTMMGEIYDLKHEIDQLM